MSIPTLSNQLSLSTVLKRLAVLAVETIQHFLDYPFSKKESDSPLVESLTHAGFFLQYVNFSLYMRVDIRLALSFRAIARYYSITGSRMIDLILPLAGRESCMLITANYRASDEHILCTGNMLGTTLPCLYPWC